MSNYRATGIDPSNLGVLRGEDPSAYLSEYRKAYKALNAEAIKAKNKAKYDSRPEVVEARAHRARKKDLEAADKQRLKKVKAEARAYMRELYADELKARRAKRKREYRKRVSAEGTAINRDKRAKLTSWADRDAVSKIFQEARRLTRSTGVEHHVDHIYPLLGASVCGLHTETNLRVVSATVNLEKSNSMPGCVAHELWDPQGSDVYYDGDLYSQTQKKAVEAALQADIDRKLAEAAAIELQSRRQAAKNARKEAERARATKVAGKRGRKPMSPEVAAQREDVQALLQGFSIREVCRAFGCQPVRLVKYARLVNPEYRSPYQKHGRPQKTLH